MKAKLNFLSPIARTPNVDLSKPGGGGLLDVHTVQVDMHALDPRAGDPAANLAARGFTALPFACDAAPDGPDPGWRDAFGLAVSRAVYALIGARGVAVVPNTILVRRGQGLNKEIPLLQCHTDFTAASATQKFARLAEARPKARDAKRFAAYNAWWLVSPGPQDAPLGLCDATTVAAADMVPGNAIVHNAAGEPRSFGEIAFYRHNPRQKWHWYPELASDRLVLFAGHDSDARFASQVPHGAFANPACPPGTPTRVSVECRLLAYW